MDDQNPSTTPAQQAAQPSGPEQGGQSPSGEQKNTPALVGMILSIASIVIGGFILAIPGLILGIIGLKKSKEVHIGRGQAIAAIVISSIVTVISLILIPLMLIGSLAYFGALSPDKFLPSKCVVNPPLSCTEFVARDGTLTMGIMNNAGMAIEGAVLTTSGDCSGTVNLGTMSNGESKRIDACTNLPSGVGEQVNIDLSIDYTKVGETISHTTTGSVMTKTE